MMRIFINKYSIIYINEMKLMTNIYAFDKDKYFKIIFNFFVASNETAGRSRQAGEQIMR